jgi:hypothetical protein
MPDAARLVAACGMAIVAFIMSGMIMPLMPDSTDFGYFTLVNMVLGVLAGWVVMGKRAGRGITPGINNGLSGLAVLVIWGLGVQACVEMFRLAMRNRYGDAFEAVTAIFQIAAEYGLIMINAPLIITAVVMSIMVGLATEFAWRQWK